MEFKPGKPQKNYNVSDTKPIKEFAVLLSGITGFVVVLYLLLGLAVDSIVDALPEEWAQVSYSDNFESPGNWQPAESLQKITDKLAMCADIAQPLRVSMSNSEEVNAFALPNGQIVVYSGLLDAVQSENGLAFVLAHELAHFKNRDHLRQMGRGIILTGLITLVTGDSGGFSEALTPAMLLGNANYSQERELQADFKAIEIIQCHYGHVAGATELFEYFVNNPVNMTQNSFLSSHPAPQKRIDKIKEMAIKNGWKMGVVKPL